MPYLSTNFFNNIEGKALDEQQQAAVLSTANTSLIVAGAGSGKTLTILGKVKWLVQVQKVSPEDILLLSFTNKTVNELNVRLAKLQLPLKATTFHKLGLNIIKKHQTTATSSVTVTAISTPPDGTLEEVINHFFSTQIRTLPKLEKTFKRYMAFYHQAPNKTERLSWHWRSLKAQLGFKKDLNAATKNYQEQLTPIIVSFINLLKAQALTPVALKNLFSYKHIFKEGLFNARRQQLFLQLALPILQAYNNHLKKENLVDFSDMINQAATLIKTHKVQLSYRHILVDEYQDISLARFNLIQSIRQACQAKLVCVGDDWQAIYRFAGSNLDLFINFERYVGPAQQLFIERTYRNSQSLIDITANFIKKNPAQIAKQPLSSKRLATPIKLLEYQPRQSWQAVLTAIHKITKEFAATKSILILARHNFDFTNIIYQLGIDGRPIPGKLKPEISSFNSQTGQLVLKQFSSTPITFCTVHKAKGLEASNVIIISLRHHQFGFPNQLANDPIISKLLGKKEVFPHAEERRLFYVALTRTKNYAYLIAPAKEEDKSIFVKELINQYNIKVDES